MSTREELPPGWAAARIGDLVYLVNGAAFKPSQWSPHGLPIIRIQNLNNPDAEFNHCSEQMPEKFLVRNGDLLFAWSGTPGTSFGAHIWRGGDAWLNQHIFNVRFDRHSLNPTFLRYAINQNLDSYIRQAHGGAGLAHITKGRFENSVLHIAPLAEQHRIVEKIDELFSDLDAGIASIKRAKANLKRCRASVLKAAVEGRLTSNRSITCKFFGELIDVLGQGWSPKCDLNRPPTADEWAVIKTTAVQPLAYRDDEAKPLPASFEPRHRLEIKAGDFLMTRKGPRQRAGVTCFVRSTRPRLMVCDTVYRFRCNPDIVNALYLEIALNSPAVMQAIDRQKCGICDSGVSLTHDKLHAIPIPLPPLEEQTDIVRLVDERFSQIDAAEKTIDAELIRSKKLRQGILKQAFEGTLVPQNPTSEQAGTALT